MDMTGGVYLGQLGMALPLALGALGSGLGVLTAGRAAMGEWGKEGKAGKVLRFQYVILTAMPLSQMIYGFIFTMLAMSLPISQGSPLVASHGAALFGLGLACGLIELASAWVQGILGAAGCRAFSDGDGKGLAFIIIVMGIAETVGLFGFVLAYLLVPTGA